MVENVKLQVGGWEGFPVGWEGSPSSESLRRVPLRLEALRLELLRME